MRLRCIVEVLTLDPKDHQIIVPLHEHIVNIPDLDSPQNIGFWEALFYYAFGEVTHLTSLLEGDSKARDLLIEFEEDWFVRAEIAQDTGSRSAIEKASKAVKIAKSSKSKNACGDILKEMGFDMQSR